MKNVAKGKFEVKGTPQPIDEAAKQIGLMRMTFDKRFSGALEATGIVSMLGVMDKDLGSGGYVAIEKITGKLNGLQGSFCLQHSSTLTRGKPSQSVTVIPDTGTENLRGLTGQMTIDIVEGQHFYTLEYDLNS